MNTMEDASRIENEGKKLSFKDWNLAPEHIRKMAEESSNEGIPTLIVEDKKLGWCILHSGQGPYIAFSEFCPIHDSLLLERKIYHVGNDLEKSEYYCYDCENIKLWNLARSVGK